MTAIISLSSRKANSGRSLGFGGVWILIGVVLLLLRLSSSLDVLEELITGLGCLYLRALS